MHITQHAAGRLLLALWMVCAVVLAACGGSDAPSDAGQGATPAAPSDPAPELTGITNWYNSDPLQLEGLRGEPVLLVFWSDT